MQQKAILVTGGAGYIGSHTAWLMAQKGYHVIVIDKLCHQQSGHTPWTTFINDDFANTVTLSRLFNTYNIQAVMHFAAFIEVHASLKDPRVYYENNVIKTAQLLREMLKHNVQHFIFSSSCALYGIPTYTPIDEQHPKHPITPYGTSKFMVEQMLHDYAHAYDFNYVSLRYFNAAGAQPDLNLGEQHQPETHIIPLLLHALHTQQPFSIFGTDYDTPDGTCMRDFLHVKDIAHAHYLALQHLERGNPSDCFNLGTGKGTSIKELIEVAQQTFSAKLHVLYDKRREGDPAILVADAQKARHILDWHPQYSALTHMLHSAYAYMHKQLMHKKLLQKHV